MNETFSTAGLKALFRYPVQGKDWGRKMLYLALFCLGGFIIPVIPWLFSCGYFAAILRQWASGDESNDLPEWEDWNRLLMDGLRMFGAGLLLAFPAVVVWLIGILFYIPAVSAGSRLAESGRDFFSFMMLSGGMSVFLCSIALGMLLTLGLGLISGPAITHMAVKGTFGALFQVKAWWQVLRANLGGYLIVIFLYIGLVYAIQFISMTLMYSFILCGLLPILLFVGMPYTSVIMAVLFGQAYREGTETLAPSEPLPDLVI